MPNPSSFDEEARTELLCHLVVAELVAMARTGNWLRTNHLVESVHIWMNARDTACDWLDRITIASIAANVAQEVLAKYNLTTEEALIPLFADGWRLDPQSSVVRDICDVCASRLRRV